MVIVGILIIAVFFGLMLTLWTDDPKDKDRRFYDDSKYDKHND
jgi:hypothetical protein